MDTILDTLVRRQQEQMASDDANAVRDIDPLSLINSNQGPNGGTLWDVKPADPDLMAAINPQDTARSGSSRGTRLSRSSSRRSTRSRTSSRRGTNARAKKLASRSSSRSSSGRRSPQESNLFRSSVASSARERGASVGACFSMFLSSWAEGKESGSHRGNSCR